MSHRAELGLSVKKAYWNQGVGSALMRRLIQYAEENGIELLSLEVRSDNIRAVRLYESFGFQRIGTSPAYFKIDGRYADFELMYLDLRKGGQNNKTAKNRMIINGKEGFRHLSGRFFFFLIFQYLPLLNAAF